MNNRELTGKVNSAMYRQCRDRGSAAPVDVLMEISSPEIERWYATHFVDTKRISQLKAAALEHVEPSHQDESADGASE